MKMSKRPINTLFMLMSLDGKINSGNSDELDVDQCCQLKKKRMKNNEDLI